MRASIRAGASDSALQQGGVDAVVFNSGGQADKLRSITASVASNALTAGLNPCVLDFRSNTLTTGTPITVAINSTLSLVVPSTATLGTVSGQASRLILLAINNAGTVELAIVNQSGGNDLSETGLISTTALSAGSDSDNVIYSTTARANVAYRVVGFIDSTQATAGTWATAPSLIQGAGGEALTTKPIKSGSVIATTSGTSHDFTGIPSWVKKITIMLSGVSTNGTSIPMIQIGDSGGIETTTYLGAASVFTTSLSSANSGAGFLTSAYHDNAIRTNGILTLSLLDASTNTWAIAGSLGNDNTARTALMAGSKALSATLDRIRLTTVNGTDVFDAGKINILYR